MFSSVDLQDDKVTTVKPLKEGGSYYAAHLQQLKNPTKFLPPTPLFLLVILGKFTKPEHGCQVARVGKLNWFSTD